MPRSFLPLVVAALGLLPPLASEPGQPLDCGDWVLVEPGLSCSYFARPCDNLVCDEVSAGAITNEGALLHVVKRPTGEACGSGGLMIDVNRLELWSFDGSDLRLLAHIAERCVDPYFQRMDLIDGTIGIFHEESGRLIVWARTACRVREGEECYDDESLAFAIQGFTTTFEILQTYRPDPGEITFRVPHMPEGMAAADWFDTYYGDLSSVGDWSRAEPLRCAYPGSTPGTADYLTVEDALPQPPAGQGYYYVTAATYVGETRYGRKSSGGVLSGRNPALLPACNR